MRIVAEDDINVIKRLWEKLNQHHHDKSVHFKDYFDANTFEKRVSKMKLDNIKIYVAYDEEPIGYIIVSLLSENHGEIDSLFLLDEYRGRGLAEQLMNKGIGWLKDNGARGIQLAVAAGNEDAFGFYERFGFKPRTHIMYLKD